MIPNLALFTQSLRPAACQILFSNCHTEQLLSCVGTQVYVRNANSREISDHELGRAVVCNNVGGAS